MAYEGVKVFSIERQQELFKKTRLLLKKLQLRPKKLIFGDGYKGWTTEAPFNAIIVTGAPWRQLAIGGETRGGRKTK